MEKARTRVFAFSTNELAEPVEGERARAALIDHGGDTGADADEVRVEPEIARDVLVDMGVRIDEARGDDGDPRHRSSWPSRHRAGAQPPRCGPLRMPMSRTSSVPLFGVDKSSVSWRTRSKAGANAVTAAPGTVLRDFAIVASVALLWEPTWKKHANAGRLFVLRLLGAEQPVAGVAEAGQNIALRVETAVERSGDDRHFGKHLV